MRSPGRALATEVESQVPVPGVCTMMPGPRDGHWHATSVARGLTVTLRGFATTEKEPLGWPRAGRGTYGHCGGAAAFPGSLLTVTGTGRFSVTARARVSASVAVSNLS